MRKVVVLLLMCCSFCLQDIDAQDLSIYEYRHVGPYRGGRVTTVCGDVHRPNIFYMGATGGGVWKTEDYGTSWNNISDRYFKTASIGSIVSSKHDSNLLYVGTGSDGLRSNVIKGKGVYKSSDAGVTWKHCGLENTGQCTAVRIHPQNDSIVYVSTTGNPFGANKERGIYKSENGGRTWSQKLFVSDTTGFSDLEINPEAPNIIYAAAWRAERKPWTIISGGKENGIYKSENGGDDWQKVGEGLPELMGKIDMAISAQNPDKIYALVEARDTLGGVYVSEDGGMNFTLVNNSNSLRTRPFYYTNLDLDPQDDNIIYVNAGSLMKSVDGGQSWNRIRTPHADQHAIWINPNDSDLFIQSNDGGANVTFNGGRTWTTQLNQGTAELYQVEVDNQYPYWLYGGQQDNYTTVAVPSMPPGSHQAGKLGFLIDAGGCETGPAVPHPTNPDIVFTNCKGRFGVYNKKTGQEKRYDVEAYYMYGHNPQELPQRFQRVSPIHVSPHNEDRIYHCSQHVHVTEDQGKTWTQISPDLTAFDPNTQAISGSPITRDITGEEFYSTIYAIRESELEEGVLWVGANDGPVHVSQDNGMTWNNVTPNIDGGGRVDCVEPSPHAKGKAYVSILRYQLGDDTPYIFKTKDYGQSWELITKGIPSDYPVRVVREDKNQEGVLYAGTEYGMFISFDDGDNWQSFQQNLPVTPITDIKWHRGDLVLSTMGRGFWIMDNVFSIASAYTAQSSALYKPKNTMRMYNRRNSSGHALVSGRMYPNNALHVDYFLADTVADLRLEFWDSDGRFINAFTSQNPDQAENKEDMATNSYASVFSNQVKTDPGLHRFKWSMSHQGPWSDGRWAYSNGPMVAPGEYVVKLFAGDESFEQSFKLKKDPRVEDVTLEELKEQERLLLDLVNLRTEIAQLESAIKEKQNNVEDNGLANAQIDRMYERLRQASGAYPKPMLREQVNYLYGIVNGADQKPGQDAHDRYAQLYIEFQAFKGDWEKLLEELE